MAIAGGAVPVIEVWLQDGKLRSGYSYQANGSAVEDDVKNCYQRIVAGDRVLLHRFGHNFLKLGKLVANANIDDHI